MASEAPCKTFWLVVEYDGTEFSGWQVQRRDRTVQGELERALARLPGGTVRVAGAGRTDAGCHALGQVVSARLSTRLDAERLRAALNAHLPRDVRVVASGRAPESFHARFDAVRRSYRYVIGSGPSALLRNRAWLRTVAASVDELNEASEPLMGHHDFVSFSRQGSEPVGTECRIAKARWTRRRTLLTFEVEADRFLYTMVRRIVATVVREAESGRGGRGVRAILGARSRRASAPAAPAHGLYLMRIRYPSLGWLPKEIHDAIA